MSSAAYGLEAALTLLIPLGLLGLHYILPVIAAIALMNRFIILPLVEHVLKMEREHQGRTIAVLVPELVVRH